LRTLEFWVDNLNPDFLFPNLSRQKDVFVSLMRGLATHLRPAPYPYGLLTLRLLGKIGGKNRKVLREPMDVTDPTSISEWAEKIKVEFSWSDEFVEGTSDSDVMSDEEARVGTDLPVEACVRYLREAAIRQSPDEANSTTSTEESKDDGIRLHQDSTLLEADFKVSNLAPYCTDVIDETTQQQVEACVQVLRVALTQIMGVTEDIALIDLNGDKMEMEQKEALSDRSVLDMQFISARTTNYDADLRNVSLGLMYASLHNFEDQVDFVKGMLTRIYMIVVSHEKDIIRIDANGSMESQSASSEEEGPRLEFGGHDQGSLKPFGYFELCGPLAHTTNPLAVNAALADFLSETSISHRSLELLDHLLSIPSSLRDETSKDKDGNIELDRGSLIYFENLLSALCERCLSENWDKRNGLYKAVCLMIEKLGSSWGKRYETNLVNIALFSLKNVPKEASIASARSFQFLIDVCARLFGKVSAPEMDPKDPSPFVLDALSPLKKKQIPETPEEPASEERNEDYKPDLICPNDEVLQIVIPELASPFNLARYVWDNPCLLSMFFICTTKVS
jgi:hypothetical protein